MQVHSPLLVGGPMSIRVNHISGFTPICIFDFLVVQVHVAPILAMKITFQDTEWHWCIYLHMPPTQM